MADQVRGDSVAGRLSEFVPDWIVNRGGPGSGHFGHAGRPGNRGGSLPSEGGGNRRYKIERPVRFGHWKEPNEYSTLSDAHKYGLSTRTGRLTTEETHRLKQYVGAYYHVVNTALREQRLISGANAYAQEWNEQLTPMIQALDRVTTENGALEKPTVLWRGITKDVFSKLRAGRTFTDPGYVSTTVTGMLFENKGPVVGWDFAGDAGAWPIEGVVEITAPAGTTGYYVGDRGPKQEYEFLLPRGLTFRVDEMDRKGMTAKMSVVPQ